MAGVSGSGARRALRNHALEIVHAGIDAADAGVALQGKARIFDGDLVVGDHRWRLPPGRLLLCGAGKASGHMARALEELLGARIADGLVIVPHGSEPCGLSRAATGYGAHPLPDRSGLAASRELLRMAEDLGPGDGMVFVLSGGASSLFEVPVEGVGLEDLQELGSLLLGSGAPVAEVNRVRTALSQVKGGRLAATASPGSILTLIVSDVIGDRLEAIGSGPTVAGAVRHDAADVLRRYALMERIPDAVAAYMGGSRGRSVARASEAGPQVTNLIVANNQTAVDGALAAATGLQYRARYLGIVDGEAREAAEPLLQRLAQGPESTCLVAGGETTVTLRGNGVGGRNQELALTMALLLDGRPGVCFASIGTDGRDGPTDAAGALVDGSTAARARAAGMDPVAALERNDSYSVLAAAGDVVVTGPTRTNVMDLQVLLRTETA